MRKTNFRLSSRIAAIFQPNISQLSATRSKPTLYKPPPHPVISWHLNIVFFRLSGMRLFSRQSDKRILIINFTLLLYFFTHTWDHKSTHKTDPQISNTFMVILRFRHNFKDWFFIFSIPSYNVLFRSFLIAIYNSLAYEVHLKSTIILTAFISIENNNFHFTLVRDHRQHFVVHGSEHSLNTLPTEAIRFVFVLSMMAIPMIEK